MTNIIVSAFTMAIANDLLHHEFLAPHTESHLQKESKYPYKQDDHVPMYSKFMIMHLVF